MFFLTKTVLMCISLCLVNEADSLKCYDCHSGVGEDCHTNPKKKQYEDDCSVVEAEVRTHPFEAPYNAKSGENTELQHEPDDECWTLTGTILNHQSIMRLCGSSKTSKLEMQIGLSATFPLLNITVDEVHRCSTDLCNFSLPPITPKNATDGSTDDSSSMPSLSPTDSLNTFVLLSCINSLFLICSLAM